MMELDLGLNDPLAVDNADVARFTQSHREDRLDALIQQSQDFLSAAIEEHVTNQGRMVAALCVGFSGGNDSTTLTHLFRNDVDFALHANTTIGIEETRDFVRNTCEEWGLALIERTPPRVEDQYRHLVLTRQLGKKGQALGGFPGPAMHFKMFQRLKERAIEQVRREVLTNSRRERFVVILGRRRTESQRRSRVGVVDIRGARVNVSPLVNWTKADLNTYRLRMAREGNPLPRNTASDPFEQIAELEALARGGKRPARRDRLLVPRSHSHERRVPVGMSSRSASRAEHRKTWGWGADPIKKRAETEYLKQFDVEEEAPTSGLMCSSCDDRFQAQLDLFGGAA